MRSALAIDIGGTKIEAAIVDCNGRVLPQSRHRAATGRTIDPDAFRDAIADVIRRALQYAEPSTLIGIGVGSAGPIDYRSGVISPLNMPDIRNFPVVEHIEALLSSTTLNLPMTLRGDGAAVVIAEHWVGAGRDVANLMSIVVSTGIGAGIISNGRLVSGVTGNAAHLGHVEVSGITGEATYGAPGTLEAIASGPHTVAWAQRQGWSGTEGTELARDYAAGNEHAIAAIRRTGKALGQAITSAAALFDLELVTIGGGFSKATPDLLDYIREPIKTHHFPYVRAVRVVPSALGDNGPLVGAAALALKPELVGK